MKKLLAMLVAALLCPAYGMEAVAKGEHGSVLRLSKSKCTNAAVLDRIAPEHVDEFMQAEVKLRSKTIAGCWVLADDDNVFLVFENGESLAMPTSVFRAEPGI